MKWIGHRETKRQHTLAVRTKRDCIIDGDSCQKPEELL
jgi:hypothetical protein